MDSDFDRFYTDLKETEKNDSSLTSSQQIERLLRPGSTYLNLNPFEVLQIESDSDEEAARKKFKKLSLLIHPDKNPDDRERADKAFDIIKKALAQIEDQFELAKCRELYTEGRARLAILMSEKRRKAKKDGKDGPIDEDDSAAYRKALWVVVTKCFADREKKRRMLEERANEEKKRMSEAAQDAVEKRKLAEEFAKNYEESRDDRRGSWRDFMVKKAKKEDKGKTIRGEAFKPPRQKITKQVVVSFLSLLTSPAKFCPFHRIPGIAYSALSPRFFFGPRTYIGKFLYVGETGGVLRSIVRLYRKCSLIRDLSRLEGSTSSKGQRKTERTTQKSLPTMAANSGEREAANKSDQRKDRDSDSDDDAAEEVLEESPDKRWSKRREQVKQRDVPGIDCAYLAMDNETGNEVVWNEVQFSERKNFRAQEEKINAVFDNLTQLVHPNLVKFHKYWTDAKSEKPRIIFITEYMSSGSMALFLQRTRKSGSPLSIKAWKKWTTQILSALNYLHSSGPPIIHGNLTCHTIFIQQNGLIKIGCVAPEAINHHVKTCRADNLRNMHYMAPELEFCKTVTPAADIYSFGICALEIAAAGGLISANGTVEGTISEECIRKALNSLEDPLQRDLIDRCLAPDPNDRPAARQLLFHPVLFEVHSLKLLAAHAIIANRMYEDSSVEIFRVPDPQTVAVTCAGREMAYVQLPNFQFDLDKYLEDVRNGIYPLTAFVPLEQPQQRQGSTRHNESSPEVAQHDPDDRLRHQKQGPSKSSDYHNGPGLSSSSTSGTQAKERETSEKAGDHHHHHHHPERENQDEKPEGHDEIPTEPRGILHMKATLDGSELTILLKLEDGMNRHLSTEIEDDDSAEWLSTQLVRGGFVCEQDEARVRHLLDSVLHPPPPDSQAGSQLTTTPVSASMSS
ncbi:unnamed protein product, partial [Mesorhabditis belari]|uniref:Protein kinase domain-containing protein n=1 Tax=Mesorhabditis belari TaxID=2138241 RepID=A0AAF3F0W3_9BILA